MNLIKKTLIPFSVLLLSIFILSACEFVTENPSNEVNNIQKEESSSDSNDSLSLVNRSRYNENLNCNMLKNAESRQNCERQLNDTVGMLLEREILASYDVSRCSQLGGDMASRCENTLNETGVKGPASAEEIALFDEIIRGERVVTSPELSDNPFRSVSYDEEKCSELKTEGFKEYCVKTVKERMERNTFEEIIMSKDQSRCDEITNTAYKNDCLRLFGVDITPLATDDIVLEEVELNEIELVEEFVEELGEDLGEELGDGLGEDLGEDGELVD